MSAERYHRHIEAARLAYRDRDAFLCDPAFFDVPVEKLVSPEYGDAMRRFISDEIAMRFMPPAGESVASCKPAERTMPVNTTSNPWSAAPTPTPCATTAMRGRRSLKYNGRAKAGSAALGAAAGIASCACTVVAAASASSAVILEIERYSYVIVMFTLLYECEN